MRGNIELIGGPPPTRENPETKDYILNFNNNYWFEKYRIDTSNPFVLQEDIASH